MTDQEAAGPNPGYSGQAYWDEYHHSAPGQATNGLVKQQTWLDCFTPLLRSAHAKSLLDLGCGSGRDSLALARAGYRVSGCDISSIAIERARTAARDSELTVDFCQHDIAHTLPYPGASFDAVICNLTLHMFTADVARDIVAEVWRCLAPGGLFMFHVNSLLDLPYRSELQPPVEALDNGMYRLGRGQTMRFFSAADCRDLLDGWRLITLDPVRMLRPDGAVQKCAWRCAAGKAT